MKKVEEWKPTKAQLARLVKKMELTKTSMFEILEIIGPLQDLEILRRLHLTQSEYTYLVESFHEITQEMKDRERRY